MSVSCDNPKTHELVNAVLGRALPNRTLIVVDPRQRLPVGHPAAGKTMQNGVPTAYVCQRQTCSAPITNPGGRYRRCSNSRSGRRRGRHKRCTQYE